MSSGRGAIISEQNRPLYVLGHSERELERLISQSRFYGELTEEVLRRAGIGPGMRVVDVGCGAGDVSLLLASLVGATGSVIGVDRSAESVQAAQERVAGAQLPHVMFRHCDLADLMLDTPVDAVVGRFVLLYLADPASTLERLRRLVRPGGLVVFQEMDMTGARSAPLVPLYETAIQVLRGRIEGTPDSPAYAYIADILRSLLPMAERLGVFTAADVQIDTLAERIRAEVLRADAVVVLPSLVGAWTRIPDDMHAAV